MSGKMINEKTILSNLPESRVIVVALLQWTLVVSIHWLEMSAGVMAVVL